MKVFPVFADRPATLHVWFRSAIARCLHVSIVHRLTARRGKGCQSWLQQQRHCVWLLAAFCSEKEERKEKKIVNPSRCVTMREMWAVCPSHSTRGKNVIRLGAAFLVTIETGAGEHFGMFRSTLHTGRDTNPQQIYWKMNLRKSFDKTPKVSGTPNPTKYLWEGEFHLDVEELKLYHDHFKMYFSTLPNASASSEKKE